MLSSLRLRLSAMKRRKNTLGMATPRAMQMMASDAQSGTNSPYSQYGLGVLSEQTSGFNRGMNGVGLGFHEPAQRRNEENLIYRVDSL